MTQTYLTPDLINAMRDLEELLPLHENLKSTTAKISEVSVRLVDGCDSASVSLVEGGDLKTPGASDGIAIELDQAQYQANEGPCLEAIKEGHIQIIDDIETDPRWPEFSKSALDRGISSTLSVPIKVDGVTGGLNLYGRTKHAFKATPRELTDLLSARAAIAIENARIYEASRLLVEQLNDAIKTREIIGEAKGILMAREGVVEDEAFQMLVTASQNTNTKLKEIAQKIVDETTQPAD
jgi:GAF domain-containing protein